MAGVQMLRGGSEPRGPSINMVDDMLTSSECSQFSTSTTAKPSSAQNSHKSCNSDDSTLAASVEKSPISNDSIKDLGCSEINDSANRDLGETVSNFSGTLQITSEGDNYTALTEMTKIQLQDGTPQSDIKTSQSGSVTSQLDTITSQRDVTMSQPRDPLTLRQSDATKTLLAVQEGTEKRRRASSPVNPEWLLEAGRRRVSSPANPEGILEAERRRMKLAEKKLSWQQSFQSLSEELSIICGSTAGGLSDQWSPGGSRTSPTSSGSSPQLRARLSPICGKTAELRHQQQEGKQQQHASSPQLRARLSPVSAESVLLRHQLQSQHQSPQERDGQAVRHLCLLRQQQVDEGTEWCRASGSLSPRKCSADDVLRHDDVTCNPLRHGDVADDTVGCSRPLRVRHEETAERLRTSLELICRSPSGSTSNVFTHQTSSPARIETGDKTNKSTALRIKESLKYGVRVKVDISNIDPDDVIVSLVTVGEKEGRWERRLRVYEARQGQEAGHCQIRDRLPMLYDQPLASHVNVGCLTCVVTEDGKSLLIRERSKANAQLEFKCRLRNRPNPSANFESPASMDSAVRQCQQSSQQSYQQSAANSKETCVSRESCCGSNSDKTNSEKTNLDKTNSGKTNLDKTNAEKTNVDSPDANPSRVSFFLSDENCQSLDEDSSSVSPSVGNTSIDSLITMLNDQEEISNEIDVTKSKPQSSPKSELGDSVTTGREKLCAAKSSAKSQIVGSISTEKETTRVTKSRSKSQLSVESMDGKACSEWYSAREWYLPVLRVLEESDACQLSLHVISSFRFDELSVRTVDDTLVIKGQHRCEHTRCRSHSVYDAEMVERNGHQIADIPHAAGHQTRHIEEKDEHKEILCNMKAENPEVIPSKAVVVEEGRKRLNDIVSNVESQELFEALSNLLESGTLRKMVINSIEKQGLTAKQAKVLQKAISSSETERPKVTVSKVVEPQGYNTIQYNEPQGYNTIQYNENLKSVSSREGDVTLAELMFKVVLSLQEGVDSRTVTAYLTPRHQLIIRGLFKSSARRMTCNF